MARNNDRERSTRRAPKDNGRRTKKKVCIFCKDHLDHVEYKDVNLLRKFMSDRGKIRARRVSGNCAQHQRAVAIAIKTARELALLPYTQRTTTERPGGRGPGRGRPSYGGDRAPAAPVDGPAAETDGPAGPEVEEAPDVEDEVGSDAEVELVGAVDEGGEA